MPPNYSLCFLLLLEMTAYCSKWYLIQSKLLKKKKWAGSTSWICPKEINFKDTIVHCVLRIFSVHLSVLCPESSLHMCSPEKDMKGQYSFGTFPSNFLHKSCISNIIHFEVVGTELMWMLYKSQLNQKEQCQLHANVFIFWSNVFSSRKPETFNKLVWQVRSICLLGDLGERRNLWRFMYQLIHWKKVGSKSKHYIYESSSYTN